MTGNLIDCAPHFVDFTKLCLYTLTSICIVTKVRNTIFLKGERFDSQPVEKGYHSAGKHMLFVCKVPGSVHGKASPGRAGKDFCLKCWRTTAR